jgi:Flp pilus assembly protein TadB
MHSQIVALASELGLELPSPETEEYLSLATMARPQALITVTLAAKNGISLDALLQSMRRRMRSLTPPDMELP